MRRASSSCSLSPVKDVWGIEVHGWRENSRIVVGEQKLEQGLSKTLLQQTLFNQINFCPQANLLHYSFVIGAHQHKWLENPCFRLHHVLVEVKARLKFAFFKQSTRIHMLSIEVDKWTTRNEANLLHYSLVIGAQQHKWLEIPCFHVHHVPVEVKARLIIAFFNQNGFIYVVPWCWTMGNKKWGTDFLYYSITLWGGKIQSLCQFIDWYTSVAVVNMSACDNQMPKMHPNLIWDVTVFKAYNMCIGTLRWFRNDDSY